ncbi:pilus assembly PilX N-terminal domain-containing protein [Pseudidiomarina atlantica]|uniref:pilus assembly PilX N-terminal domain-containing protein n=1 Tax=Pseudidiomarina atlantica TaxID=1517416 RepID=UPI00068E87A8|nr:pilus assembly PilX N-terminal domain-containing protein [Pseudidiomarina atlantica]
MHFNQLENSRGFATVTLTVMLLAIIILVTLYTARFKAQEQRIMRNHLAMLEARTVADAALEQTIMELDKDRSNLDRTISGDIGGAEYTATITSVNYPNTPRGNVDVVEVQVIAESADGAATQRAAQKLVVMSLVRGGPNVPLAIRGGINVSGSFQVVANPNGGGDGVPLSIWTDDTVTMSGAGTTCGQWEFDNNVCESQSFSSRGEKGVDILDDDPNFPDDLLDYLFGVPEENWEDLRAMATQVLTDCGALGPNTTGLIWVEPPQNSANGSCNMPNGDVGQQDAPAIIIVQDSDFKMNGNNELFGMVFQFNTPGNTTDYKISLNGGAFVNGSIMASQNPDLSNGNLTVRYDSNVLQAVVVNDEFRRLYRVGGSWHDF